MQSKSELAKGLLFQVTARGPATEPQHAWGPEIAGCLWALHGAVKRIWT
jgi:hypothetical protein